MRTTERLTAGILALSMFCTLLAGCAKKEETRTNEGSSAEASASEETATGGSFVITLRPDVAPITCENFKKLVNEGFYDGLTFHRVVEDFMAQGGDPNGDGTGGSDETIKGEFKSNGVDNPLSHVRGTVSMARSNPNDSASSQFFICYSDSCSFLDGNYAAFGTVDEEGMAVVDSFLKVERSANMMGEIATPNTPIVMEKVEMVGDNQVKITMNDFLG